MRTITEYTNSQIKRYWNKRITKEELDGRVYDVDEGLEVGMSIDQFADMIRFLTK